MRFQPIYFLFESFILACGTTLLFRRDGVLSTGLLGGALVRLAIGLVSWGTVIYLIKAIPVPFSLKSPEALEWKVALREGAKAALRQRATKLGEATRVAQLGL